MKVRHALLARQLKRYFPDPETIPHTLWAFIDAVDSAYRQSDIDRGMLERSLDLSSQELLQMNAEMRAVHGLLEERVRERTDELSRANAELVGEIAERKRFEAQLVHIASHDPLTDLFNRRRFEEELATELRRAEASGSQGALLFLDLDQFKDVNDTLGHAAGDDLLNLVVNLLRSCLREEDVLARQGGDEFAILLPNVPPARAKAMAAQIEGAIRAQVFWLDQRPVNVTASIGMALFPRHGATTQELLSNADLAMYQAKSNGRSRVEAYRTNRDWRSVSEGRLRWRNRIMEALQHDKFVLYAQPMHNLAPDADDTLDYELLLRLPAENGEVVRPKAFMDVAEEFSLIQDIDRWVVQQAIDIIARQERAGLKVRVAVNLSGRSFADGELLTLVRGWLAASSIDPSSLVTEVTETAAIANLGQAQKFIRTLKDLGLRFSLDDFGVGFSSFNHLKRLPVDYLKIDGSFIKDLPRSGVDQQLVKAMVNVARGLGKQTIAEFVGSQETVDLLRGYGVDFAQGYFIGRPREVEKVLYEARLAKAA